MTINNNSDIVVNLNFNYNNSNIDQLIKNNIIYRFTNEYNSSININNINNNDEDRKIDIEYILNKLSNNEIKNCITEINKYKQIWNKLNIDQKQFKIEEFIKNNEKIINKKKILNYLIENISTNKLLFIYDSENCRITNITKINGDEVDFK